VAILVVNLVKCVLVVAIASAAVVAVVAAADVDERAFLHARGLMHQSGYAAHETQFAPSRCLWAAHPECRWQ
jgi:hypothetical protein